MTEQELLSQAAKLKAIYAQNMNTTRNNSIAALNADKESFTNDANAQLEEQKDATLNTKTNADIEAFNNASKLRELASKNGFSNGGELFSGVLRNDQAKSTQIGSANKSYATYKGRWDTKLNEYNTQFNNNLNKYNSEADNAINQYNATTDMDYQNKISSLRAQIASAAASAAKSRAAATVSPTAAYNTYKTMLQGAMNSGQGGDFLWGNYSKIVNTVGADKFATLQKYYQTYSTSADKNAPANILSTNSRMSNAKTL